MASSIDFTNAAVSGIDRFSALTDGRRTYSARSAIDSSRCASMYGVMSVDVAM